MERTTDPQTRTFAVWLITGLALAVIGLFAVESFAGREQEPDRASVCNILDSRHSRADDPLLFTGC